jgi:hypothetical protein
MCLIFTDTITPRLQYITDFIGKEIYGKPFELTTDADLFSNHTGPKINYSHKRINNEELLLNNCDLLFENLIREQNISCFGINDFRAFFKTEGDYPFDIFAASFYLLTRYEEWLPHKKDMYGRYAHENSLAFKEGFLHLPLINIWLNDFKKVLKEKFPNLTTQNSRFTFLPTYDIDEAFSYKHKGFMRTIGGAARQLTTGKLQMLKERIKVLSGRSEDPYDSYCWTDSLHKEYQLNPIYFFHVAQANGKYDKNILPSQPAIQQLIMQHAEKYSIGIHPSWRSGDDESLLEKEIRILETLTEKKITSSRQHYIRFTLPNTFRRLIDAGITDDYSMGYGSINGFRASVASSFYWYDLEKEESTKLLLHPFCFMEANSYYEQKYSLQQTTEELKHYYTIIKSVNGILITIWHNSFLGTDKRFTGWREVYKEFVKDVEQTR